MEQPIAAEALAPNSAVPGQLPYGPCRALETSNTFTALVGGDTAVFAVRVMFFQRHGYDATAAVSSGAIARLQDADGAVQHDGVAVAPQSHSDVQADTASNRTSGPKPDSESAAA